jgi:GDP/UDP-N,N'-diacetylbacillosamine 2-epimerase (hydrolysing)
MRILYLTGTRADYGLMRRTLLACDARYDLSLVVTGMHLEKKYGLTIKNIVEDGLTIWKKIPLPHSQKSLSHMMDNMHYLEKKLEVLIQPNQFDLCVVEGDRYEMLAMAKVAKLRGIPIMHQGGGDKSGGIDDALRNQITAYADIHLAGNKESAVRLLKRGIPKSKVHMFGEPGLDDIVSHAFTSRAIIDKRYHIDPKKKLLLCIMHPDTTSRVAPKRQIIPVLDAIKTLGVPSIIIYPNNDAGSADMVTEIEKLRKEPFAQIFPSLNRSDFLGILAECDVFIGNSSAGLIEASLMGVPFVNVGNRQKGRLADKSVISVPNNASRIVTAVRKNLQKKGTFKLSYVYGRGDFTKQCMKLLHTYERNR